MAISYGSDSINEVFIGDMGVQQMIVGDDVVYQRDGSYCYIELKNELKEDE